MSHLSRELEQALWTKCWRKAKKTSGFEYQIVPSVIGRERRLPGIVVSCNNWMFHARELNSDQYLERRFAAWTWGSTTMSLDSAWDSQYWWWSLCSFLGCHGWNVICVLVTILCVWYAKLSPAVIRKTLSNPRQLPSLPFPPFFPSFSLLPSLLLQISFFVQWALWKNWQRRIGISSWWKIQEHEIVLDSSYLVSCFCRGILKKK